MAQQPVAFPIFGGMYHPRLESLGNQQQPVVAVAAFGLALVDLDKVYLHVRVFIDLASKGSEVQSPRPNVHSEDTSY